jgi:hypothetical protein
MEAFCLAVETWGVDMLEMDLHLMRRAYFDLMMRGMM